MIKFVESRMLTNGEFILSDVKLPCNEIQVGGDHYRSVDGEQLWDRIARLGLDYFQGNIIKYVERWKNKGGIQDLEKAKHYLEKYIEIETRGKNNAN